MEPFLWSDEHHLSAAARDLIEKLKLFHVNLAEQGSCLRLPRLTYSGHRSCRRFSLSSMERTPKDLQGTKK